jgi:D-lactate dehydrogenase (cytochrome)
VSVRSLEFAGAETRAWVVDELRRMLGERLSTAPAVVAQHGHDESYHATLAPDAVAFVDTTEEVSAVLSLCHAANMPVVPFGAGTSLEGGVSAPYGGVSLDLSRMDTVLSVNLADLDAVVQAGVTQLALNRVVRPQGVFFSVDPGAEATLGGMCATRASGTTAVRYGTMRDNVLGLTAVLADGTVIRTGGRARKSAAGYDLTGLLLGSEGTLAVITEVIVRLHPTPECVHAATCSFPDLADAVGSVVAVLQSGVTPARVELLDEVMVDAVVRFSGLELAPGPAVFFEFHGSPASVREQVDATRAICADFNAARFASASDTAARASLWRARHDALPAARALRAGAVTWSTDVCVPVSRLAECLLQTKQDLEASGLVAPIAGHVGDGNFHLALVLDPDDDRERARARSLNDAMVARALAMGGTCTGEHGVGLGKLDHLAVEAGASLGVMQALKGALDPRGILNPGKVFTPRPESVLG